MKIIIHGPLSGPGWDGSPALKSWGPDQEVEVDDKDAKAVAWAKGWAGTPHATLVEDVKEKETKAPAKDGVKAEPKAEPPKAEAKAEAKADVKAEPKHPGHGRA